MNKSLLSVFHVRKLQEIAEDNGLFIGYEQAEKELTDLLNIGRQTCFNALSFVWLVNITSYLTDRSKANCSRLLANPEHRQLITGFVDNLCHYETMPQANKKHLEAKLKANIHSMICFMQEELNERHHHPLS